MNAHVLNTSQTRMPALAGAPPVATSGLAGDSAALGARLVFAELNTTTGLDGFTGALDDGIGEDASGVAGLVGNIGMDASRRNTTFLVVCVVVYVFVAMAVLMVMAMLVSSMSVGMTVAAQDEETDEVGKETGATNDKDELGVFDLRRLDESCDGFEDDGYAKGDKEDGVEESTKNFGSYPLCETSGQFRIAQYREAFSRRLDIHQT